MAGFRLASVRDQQRMRRRWSVNDLGIAALVGLPPLVNNDDFSTNTLASYTQHQDSGSPVWTISSGALSGASAFGLQATLIRNGFSAANCSVECSSGQMNDAGIVLRYQDQNNFYLLALSDDSGANPTANMRLFKRVAGTFTQLGSSVNITFARNVDTPRFRLTASGTSLIAYFNGVAQISVTDSAISAAGGIGARSSSASADTFADLSWG
jgi:hypothetical protein